MFGRILAAIDDVSQIQDVLDLVKDVAEPGQSQVRERGRSTTIMEIRPFTG